MVYGKIHTPFFVKFDIRDVIIYNTYISSIFEIITLIGDNAFYDCVDFKTVNLIILYDIVSTLFNYIHAYALILCQLHFFRREQK